MSWFYIEITARKTYRIKIRKWHPGFWIAAYRTLRGSGSGVFESLYLTWVFARKC